MRPEFTRCQVRSLTLGKFMSRFGQITRYSEKANVLQPEERITPHKRPSALLMSKIVRQIRKNLILEARRTQRNRSISQHRKRTACSLATARDLPNLAAQDQFLRFPMRPSM